MAYDVDEAAWLIAHENGLGTFIYGIAHNDSFTVDSTIGTQVYLHANSAGKAILSQLPESEVKDVIDRHGLPAQTEHTITDRETLFDELEVTRDRGYAMNFKENLRGLHATTTLIIDDGRPIAAVTIAGDANRLTKERIEEGLYELLLEAVDDIKLRLVYG